LVVDFEVHVVGGVAHEHPEEAEAVEAFLEAGEFGGG
jgi:hypothetical protein